jgi:SAM-dependent methyltransferase
VVRSFVDLGVTPLANSYLSADQLDRAEPRYPLHAKVCDSCLLVQIEPVVKAEEIFTDYAYFSSYSASWVEHARQFANETRVSLGLTGASLVVELASNDGYLLKHYVEAGIPVLGIEPAINVARVAMNSGVRTETAFFGVATAENLMDRGLQADLLVANNVLAHVPDVHDFVAGMAMILKPDGCISIEVPSLLRLITDVQFDTIYHEHFSYFSLLTAETVLRRSGLVVFDVEDLPTHGGSLRIWAAHGSAGRRASARLIAARETELYASIQRIETYSGFQERVDVCRDSLLDFLGRARRAKQIVAGYGAAAKGNTMLNFCGVTVEDIPYVVDRSPHKQGRFLPGTRVPILAPSAVDIRKPAYLLILPWNLRSEIMEEMSQIRAWEGRFVTAIPTVEVHP